VQRPKRKKPEEYNAPIWLLSWGDLTTLLLTFFVMMYDVGSIDQTELDIVLSAFQGLGNRTGGNTLQVGKMAELGNTMMSLPSMEKGQALARARKTAVSSFQPEIKSRLVRVKEDERGLVISLASDAYFKPGSAEINIEDTRTLLQRMAALLSSPELADRKFRIEGHTDNTPTAPGGLYPTNWELSTARSTTVLHYLVDLGVNEKQFQAAGFADTVPAPGGTNDTPEGRAYNRRIEIVILNEGHL
jgi:chemotaxis protein MotB